MNYCRAQPATADLTLVCAQPQVTLLPQSTITDIFATVCDILQQYMTISQQLIANTFLQQIVTFIRHAEADNIVIFKILDYFQCQYSDESVVKVRSVIIPHPMSHNRVPVPPLTTPHPQRECSCKFASDKQILQ